jgi:hypothetical protein
MGAIQTICQRCGSTHVNGRCDCSGGQTVNLVQCAYCGVHTTSDRIIAGKCAQCQAHAGDQSLFPRKPPAQE